MGRYRAFKMWNLVGRVYCCGMEFEGLWLCPFLVIFLLSVILPSLLLIPYWQTYDIWTTLNSQFLLKHHLKPKLSSSWIYFAQVLLFSMIFWFHIVWVKGMVIRFQRLGLSFVKQSLEKPRDSLVSRHGKKKQINIFTLLTIFPA